MRLVEHDGRGFASSAPLAVSQVDATTWETTAELVYQGTWQTLRVPVGSRTDFASAPLLVRWFVDVVTGAPAAVLHDWCWRYAIPAGLMEYREADGLLRQALGTVGVPTVKRWAMWAGVRWGSLLTRRNGWRGWWKDAPAVLGVSLALIPIVTVPLVVTAPFYGLYRIVEAITP
jgi:hypothetical protein